MNLFNRLNAFDTMGGGKRPRYKPPALSVLCLILLTIGSTILVMQNLRKSAPECYTAQYVSNQRIEAWEDGYQQAYADAIAHKGWVNIKKIIVPGRKPVY